MDLSLSGCGFLGLYHLGVVSCLKEHAPQFVQSIRSVSGASAGALSGLVLLADCPLGLITNELMKVVREIRSSSLGPYKPTLNITNTLRNVVELFAPENIHKIVSGRLFISLTRLSDMRNVVISEFHSKNDLIQALCCSSFVPLWSGVAPLIYRGEHYIDGGFSDNQPQPFGDNTILVSPFYGESDICPNDNTMTFHQFSCNGTSLQMSTSNIYRLSRALFPPEPRVLRSMCQQGYLDALRFLQNKLQGYLLYGGIRSTTYHGENSIDKGVRREQEPFKLDIMNLREENDTDSFSTCSEESSSYEEICTVEKSHTFTIDINGIQLPFGIKEAFHLAITEPHATPVLHYLSSFLLTPYSIVLDTLVAIASRLLDDIPALHARLRKNCNNICDTLKNLVESIKENMPSKYSFGMLDYDGEGLYTMTKNLPRRLSRKLSKQIIFFCEEAVTRNFSSLADRVRIIKSTMGYFESWELSHLLQLLHSIINYIFQRPRENNHNIVRTF